MKAKTVEIKDVGPVKRLSLPIPKNGGIVVLSGPNGCGKSESIEAITATVTGNGDVSCRDGAKKGSVDAFGITLTIGSRKRRSGECTVESIDSKFDVADVVDPQIDNPGAADAKRIKALLQVAGAKADATLFHSLAETVEDFHETVKPASIDTDDPVKMASAIKRDFEAAARKTEDAATNFENDAKARKASAADVNIDVETDERVLQSAMEKAIGDESALTTRANQVLQIIQRANKAREEKARHEAEYAGPTVERAVEELNSWNNKFLALQEKVTAAHAVWVAAVEECKAADNQMRLAHLEHVKAVERTTMLASWSKAINDSANVKPIADEELAAARQRITEARQALERGSIARKAKSDIAAAEQRMETVDALRKKAGILRDSAKGTDDVLSGLIGRLGSPLRVAQDEAGYARLVLDTDRGETYFADLSDGERWGLVVPIAITAVQRATEGTERGGFIGLKQVAWEGLDLQHRNAIAAMLDGSGVTLITAEASRDRIQEEIEAKVFTSAGA